MGEDLLHMCMRCALHPLSSACLQQIPRGSSHLRHNYAQARHTRASQADGCRHGIKDEAQPMAYTYFSKELDKF
jgi:hypothetical protein